MSLPLPIAALNAHFGLSGSALARDCPSPRRLTTTRRAASRRRAMRGCASYENAIMGSQQKGLLAAIAVLIATTGASAEVAERRLNLRSGPGPAFSIIAVMPAGARVAIEKCSDQWCRLTFGRHVGYASRTYLGDGSGGADALASAEPPSAANAKPTSTGPRIWNWQDRDARDRNWRRLGWHNRLR